MRRLIFIAAGVLAASSALAHTGHGLDGFAAGFGHPFHGLDHLLAVVAVGAWAATLGRRLLVQAPAGFMAAISVGALAAFAGLPFPAVDLVLAASVVALGVLLAGAYRLRAGAAALLVAGFGVAHGHAHGAALPPGGSGVAYGFGLLIATAMLHALGALAALAALEWRRGALLRGAGAVLAAAGLWLAAPALAAGSIAAQDVWARPSMGAHGTGAAYMTLVNHGDAPDRLLAVATPAAERAELHAHLHEGGVMRMRQVEAVEVPVGEPAVLAPGGLHVMLIGLAKPLREGDRFPLTLTFEKAGEVTVEVAVQMSPAGGHGRSTH